MMETTLIQQISIWALPVLFAITLHEVAHGWVASWFGDQTARLAGRLTLNPIKHVDLVGTVIVPLFLLVLGSGMIFGWAKPVPVDARNLRHPRRDMIFVALAGPLSNLLMAMAWAVITKLAMGLPAWFYPIAYMGDAGIMINLVLGVLNIIPIPPMDGGRVLMNMLPGRIAWRLHQFEPYSFIILILLIMSGVLSFVISPIVYVLLNSIHTLFGLS